MLLALDAGNTNITIGAFLNGKLTGRWRLRTIRDQTPDEWGILMRNLFSLSELDLSQVHGVVISSVVPAVDQPLTAMAERYFKREPMFVTPATDTGIKVLYDNPREVGADRVVNAVAGFHKYGGPCVIVDLGTTINFDVVSKDAEFLGGLIAPGHRHVDQRAVCPHRAPADGRFPGAGETGGQQYGGQHSIRSVLRIYRADRRHRRTHREAAGPGRPRPLPPGGRGS